MFQIKECGVANVLFSLKIIPGVLYCDIHMDVKRGFDLSAKKNDIGILIEIFSVTFYSDLCFIYVWFFFVISFLY